MSTSINSFAVARSTQISDSFQDLDTGGTKDPLPLAQPDEDLSAELILKNLPVYISSLGRDEAWQCLAPGNCEYFRSLRVDNFAQWVGECVHVQDRVAILKAVNDCRREKISTTTEFRLSYVPSRSDVPQWVEIKCEPIALHNTILTVLRDVSQRRIFADEMLNARKNADEANVAKTRFLANISHELRTPLNAIIGFSEILKSGMVSTSQVEKQKEYHCLINESAHHLLMVLNDVLDMSKIEAGKYDIHPEDIDLKQIIFTCCSMFMPMADNAGVKLRVANPDEPLRLEADSKAIRQILTNLISNAIKFARHGTEILISARRVGRKIEFEVRDQGVGISANSLDGLGEPFHQLDNEKSRRHEGTGLGLSIVKGLVQLHEGSFAIASEVDIGTTVTIQVPHTQGLSQPVPFQDADTIIRIKPNQSEPGQRNAAISRMVG